MSMRNEWCLAIPPSIFSLCPNKKHVYKYSFALPSMYDSPIHFGQSICSVYTLRVGGELKGLYDHWPGKTTGGWVALYTAFFKRPSPSHRAPPLGSACLGESEHEKLKNTLIWCHRVVQHPAHCLKGSLCLYPGQLERSTSQKTLW